MCVFCYIYAASALALASGSVSRSGLAIRRAVGCWLVGEGEVVVVVIVSMFWTSGRSTSVSVNKSKTRG
jgi:hypothetical protein